MLNISKSTTQKYVELISENKLINFRNYHGGLFEISRYMRGCLAEWRRDILAKHGNRCFITGRTDKLIIHHVTPFSDIRDMVLKITGLRVKRFDEYSKNELEELKEVVLMLHQKIEGVVLNESIHTLFHQYYGNVNIGFDELKEFHKRYQIGEIEII